MVICIHGLLERSNLDFPGPPHMCHIQCLYLLSVRKKNEDLHIFFFSCHVHIEICSQLSTRFIERNKPLTRGTSPRERMTLLYCSYNAHKQHIATATNDLRRLARHPFISQTKLLDEKAECQNAQLVQYYIQKVAICTGIPGPQRLN